MATDSNGMPPIAAVQAALHRITESLATDLGCAGAERPAWSELEWRLAPAVAAIHGISPLLAGSLRWQGPPYWAEFLAEQHRHTLLRQQRIDNLLKTIDERSRSAGIGIVALKGAALQASGIYAAGERPMADLDLLVHPDDVETAVAVLLALSYRDAGTTWKHQGFEPASAVRRSPLGEHADNPVKIDLHHRTCERLALTPADVTNLVRPQRNPPGLNPYPSLAALMAHVLVHTAGSMVHRGLRLIQLCDISRLARRMAAPDWEGLLAFNGRTRRLWWAAAPLILTARYFPKAIPEEIIRSLGRDCPWLIRRTSQRRSLTDFSYSHLYIDPIPGIVWARSPLQAARYLLARARPDQTQLAQLDLIAKTGPWASDPTWYELPQSRRIVRWLTSRPTRVETMQPVRAALGG